MNGHTSTRVRCTHAPLLFHSVRIMKRFSSVLRGPVPGNSCAAPVSKLIGPPSPASLGWRMSPEAKLCVYCCMRRDRRGTYEGHLQRGLRSPICGTQFVLGGRESERARRQQSMMTHGLLSMCAFDEVGLVRFFSCNCVSFHAFAHCHDFACHSTIADDKRKTKPSLNMTMLLIHIYLHTCVDCSIPQTLGTK